MIKIHTMYVVIYLLSPHCFTPNLGFECILYFSLARLEFLFDGAQPDVPATYHKTFEFDRNGSKIAESILVVKLLATTKQLPENI